MSTDTRLIRIVITVIVRLLHNPITSNPNPLAGTTVDVAALLGFGLLVPLIQEAAKAAPAIFLPNRKDFPETVDGLVFGIAAGLGFSLAETLINFATTLQYLGHVAPANWIYPLTTISVLSPLIAKRSSKLPAGACSRTPPPRSTNRSSLPTSTASQSVISILIPGAASNLK